MSNTGMSAEVAAALLGVDISATKEEVEKAFKLRARLVHPDRFESNTGASFGGRSISGCLLCCFELRLKMISVLIAKYFGLLFNPKGRIIFILFCGCLMFSLNSIMGFVVGAYVCALVPANVYILLQYPDLEKKAIDYRSNGMRAAANVVKSHSANSTEMI